MLNQQPNTKRREDAGDGCDFCTQAPRWSVRCKDANDIEDWFVLCDEHLAHAIQHGIENGRYEVTFARLVR